MVDNKTKKSKIKKPVKKPVKKTVKKPVKKPAKKPVKKQPKKKQLKKIETIKESSSTTELIKQEGGEKGYGCSTYNYPDNRGRILENRTFFRSTFMVDKFFNYGEGWKKMPNNMLVTFDVKYHALKHLNGILHNGGDEDTSCPPLDYTLIYNLSRIIQDSFIYTNHLSQFFNMSRYDKLQNQSFNAVLPLHISSVLLSPQEIIELRIPPNEQYVNINVIYSISNFSFNKENNYINLDINIFSIVRCLFKYDRSLNAQRCVALYDRVESLKYKYDNRVPENERYDKLNVSVIYGNPPVITDEYLRQGQDNIPKLLELDENIVERKMQTYLLIDNESPTGMRPSESEGSTYGLLPQRRPSQPRPRSQLRSYGFFRK